MGYCVFADGSECEEWAFYRGECEPATAAAGVANPASAYCFEQGGKLEIRSATDGETGYCVFADGTECEEWAFMRDDCGPGSSGALSLVTSDISTDDLVASVKSQFPEGAFEDVLALPLQYPADQDPLWAVYSVGGRNYNLASPPAHFVAIYTYRDEAWESLGRLEFEFEEDANAAAVPDYVFEYGVQQVQIAPQRTWLTLEGGMGAHSGTFHLLSFDGTHLRVEIAGDAASPGAGSVFDVNGDGMLDVLLNRTNPYIFCYACGVRQVLYQVFEWNRPNARFFEMQLQPLLMGQPQPLREPANRAVSLAEAGLWKDAVAASAEAMALLPEFPEADTTLVTWNDALIRLHAEDATASARDSGYPLLSWVLYGDYEAAMDIVREVAPEEVFSPESPLIVDTAAEQWVSELSNYLTRYTTTALWEKPDLAAAYFLRGWAAYLREPDSDQILADVARAAELAPDDAFLAACVGLLQ
ncbi:MAG: DUF333 domain-containing protein [Anaerolineae bacterium]|nr:DUF333 domain-containing protein [Anaerolineae bacterium]